MAGNNQHQTYRQGPPPQQRYFDNQYDRNDQYEEMDYNGRRPNQMYNSRSEGYNENHNDYHREQNQQPHNDHYESYEHWDNGGYQEPQYQEQYHPRSQNLDQGPRQQRFYQYDDRYRMNGPNRQPPPQNQYGRPPPRSGDSRQPLSPQDRPYGNMGRGGPNQYDAESATKQSRVRERILQQQPESPTTPSWDNPFPTFPTKKKQAESKKSEQDDSKQDLQAVNAQPQELPRPSTSHGNQQRAEPPNVELPRPHTSHSQRSFEPLRSPMDAPPMPFQQGFQRAHPQSSFTQESQGHEQSRPLPRRAMTGPAPSQQSESPNQFGQQHRNDQAERRDENTYDNYLADEHGRDLNYQDRPVQRRPIDNGHQNPPPSHHSDSYDDRSLPPKSDAYGYEQRFQPPRRAYTEQQDLRGPSQQPMYQQPRKPVAGGSYIGGPNGHRRQSSDQSHGRNPASENEQVDSGTYRGVPLTRKVSPEMPRFDYAEKRNERIEDRRGPPGPQPGVAYRKPTYESPVLLQSGPTPGPQSYQHEEEGNNLASPLAQFSFELDASKSPTYAHENQQQNSNSDYQRAEAQRSQNGRIPSNPGQNRPMQHPPRSASRPQEFSPVNPHGHPSSRPPPYRPGLAQPPTINQNLERSFQDYSQDRTSYDSGFSRDASYDRPQMPPSQASYHSEPSRQGYDQRIQPRPGFTSPQQIPPRPATSNSGRPGLTADYGPRPSSDSHQWNGMQNPDSLPAHPAPFRPGLMQPAPPAPRPTPPPQPQLQLQPQPQIQTHSRAPSTSKSIAEAEPQVTIGELNSLRQDYKNHPNDHALGLRFAKRLVEASKVLSNEGGRADAKQTAKNRERYILDAHKIVKRLCSSGYAEAMFYMADCYGQGLLGLEVDPKEAFSLYQSAAKLGHAQAAYRVAVCCELGAEEGGGTRRDPLKAVQWYKRAATLGDTPAMYKMGMIQLKGLLGQPKSPREAISWLKRAAERADVENPHALHELGLLYENAQSTDIILKDEKYALQLFNQAADLGYKYSQFRLGSAYEYGLLGLAIDPRMSIAWYSRAAKQGEHQSEFALSGWYLTGSGQSSPGEQPLLHQSDTEAYLWARKAASSGLAKAEYAMGYYTEVGIGTASNIEEAKRWYYRAAAQNHPKARERLEDLKKGGQRMQKTRVSRSNVGKHNEGECTVM